MPIVTFDSSGNFSFLANHKDVQATALRSNDLHFLLAQIFAGFLAVTVFQSQTKYVRECLKLLSF